jgi:hypothetical protein
MLHSDRTASCLTLTLLACVRFNLETAGTGIPETSFFEGDSAFNFLGLTRTQRLYGFVGWYNAHAL